MIRTAVLMTVYNRIHVTLMGLRSLYNAIEFLGNGYIFDIYMTDDGCTDGTAEAISVEFPSVIIVQGNGKLFWSGGMRKAWQAAIDSGENYDFYLWFNDDADLYKDALLTMFKSSSIAGENAIITGAFCDKNGKATYGGKFKNRTLVQPMGSITTVELMNGNLVLIPDVVFGKVGLVSNHYRHGFGDYDYGLRANKMGVQTYLSGTYVGKTERHDELIPIYFSKDKTIFQRWGILHDPRNSPIIAFRFNITYFGFKIALEEWVRSYLYLLFPKLYYKRHQLS